MNKILERYLAKTFIQMTALSAVVITAILFIITVLSEFKSIGKGEYGLSQAILFVLMQLPNKLYQFSPMFVLLGSIIALSLLSTYRELVVMRVSGYAIYKIIISIILTAFAIVLSISIVGERFAPNLSYQAEIYKENAKNIGSAVVTASGVWLHVDNNFIHIRHVLGRQLLEDVTLYQFNDQHQLQAAYYAKRLSLKNHEWMMQKVMRTTFMENRTKSESFDRIPWKMRFNQNLLNIGLVEPNEMSMSKLKSLANYLEKNGLRASEYRYDFWRRVFQPLASLVMIFLAVPFVLGTFKNANIGWRMMVGLVTGFVFFIINALLGQLCMVYQIPIILAAALPTIFFLFVGIFLSRSLIKL